MWWHLVAASAFRYRISKSISLNFTYDYERRAFHLSIDAGIARHTHTPYAGRAARHRLTCAGPSRRTNPQSPSQSLRSIATKRHVSLGHPAQSLQSNASSTSQSTSQSSNDQSLSYTHSAPWVDESALARLSVPRTTVMLSLSLSTLSSCAHRLWRCAVCASLAAAWAHAATELYGANGMRSPLEMVS